jgi:hypothetical protein
MLTTMLRVCYTQRVNIMESTTLKALIPSEMSPALRPVLVTSTDGLLLLEDFLKRVSVFGFDLETNMTDDFIDRRIRTIQIGDRNEQYIIDLLPFAGSKEALIAGQGYGGNDATQLLFGRIIDTIRKAIESRDWLKVGTNLQFDYETTRFCLGLRMDGVHDLMRGENNTWAGLVPLNFKGTDFWGLDKMAERYLGLSISKDEQSTFDLETPITEAQIIYGALDVRLPISIRGGQVRQLEAEGLMRAAQIDFDAIPTFGDMHLHGLLVDETKWQALIDDNLSKRLHIIKRLDDLFIPVVGTKEVSQVDLDKLKRLEDNWRATKDAADRKIARGKFMAFRKIVNGKSKLAKDCQGEAAINYKSNPQLLEALKEMGFKKLKDTNDDTLEKLAKFPNLTIEGAFEEGDELNYPAIDVLRLLRTVNKQLDTYGTAWITDWTQDGHLHPATRRIHSNFNLFGADTGRTSSSSPNVQNLPKTKRFRNCFIARPGYKVLTIDMAGAELRIMAEMSGERVWLEAFAKGWDVHSVGAEMLYGDRWKSATVHEPYTVVKDGETITIPKCAYYYEKNGKDHDKCKCPEHESLRSGVKAVKS